MYRSYQYAINLSSSTTSLCSCSVSCARIDKAIPILFSNTCEKMKVTHLALLTVFAATSSAFGLNGGAQTAVRATRSVSAFQKPAMVQPVDILGNRLSSSVSSNISSRWSCRMHMHQRRPCSTRHLTLQHLQPQHADRSIFCFVIEGVILSLATKICSDRFRWTEDTIHIYNETISDTESRLFLYPKVHLMDPERTGSYLKLLSIQK